MQNQPSPLILSFGVSDPVGALGVQADVAAFAALGCHGLSAVSGLLVADSARVNHVHELESDWMAEQARTLLEDMPVAAFKVGAMCSALHLAAIAEIVSDYPDAPLVLDPFLSALPLAGIDNEDILYALRAIVVPQATALLLSQSELGRMAELWREGDAGTVAEDVAELTASGLQYVIITGHCDPDGTCANLLFDASGEIARVPWQPLGGPFTGAGSTLSAAFTACLARGLPADTALAVAQEYTQGALAHAQRYGMGKFIPNKSFHLSPASRPDSSLRRP